jgi:hypothetical protein
LQKGWSERSFDLTANENDPKNCVTFADSYADLERAKVGRLKLVERGGGSAKLEVRGNHIISGQNEKPGE